MVIDWPFWGNMTLAVQHGIVGYAFLRMALDRRQNWSVVIFNTIFALFFFTGAYWNSRNPKSLPVVTMIRICLMSPLALVAFPMFRQRLGALTIKETAALRQELRITQEAFRAYKENESKWNRAWSTYLRRKVRECDSELVNMKREVGNVETAKNVKALMGQVNRLIDDLSNGTYTDPDISIGTIEEPTTPPEHDG